MRTCCCSLDAITTADWLLAAHAGQPDDLELSVPMLPRTAGVSLRSCAAGAYDAQ